MAPDAPIFLRRLVAKASGFDSLRRKLNEFTSNTVSRSAIRAYATVSPAGAVYDAWYSIFRHRVSPSDSKSTGSLAHGNSCRSPTHRRFESLPSVSQYPTRGNGSVSLFRLNGTENPWLPLIVRQSTPTHGARTCSSLSPAKLLILCAAAKTGMNGPIAFMHARWWEPCGTG